MSFTFQIFGIGILYELLQVLKLVALEETYCIANEIRTVIEQW